MLPLSILLVDEAELTAGISLIALELELATTVSLDDELTTDALLTDDPGTAITSSLVADELLSAV